MNIPVWVRDLLLKIAAVILPYFMKTFTQVLLPMLLAVTPAVLSKDPEGIKKAKAEARINWGKFIDQSALESAATPSKIDDSLFQVLKSTEIDDAFMDSLVTIIQKNEELFFGKYKII